MKYQIGEEAIDVVLSQTPYEVTDCQGSIVESVTVTVTVGQQKRELKPSTSVKHQLETLTPSTMLAIVDVNRVYRDGSQDRGWFIGLCGAKWNR